MNPEQMVVFVSMFAASAMMMFGHFQRNRLSRPNVISVMYLSHVGLQLIPSCFFLANSTRPAAQSYFDACALSALLIPLGSLIADQIVPLRPIHQCSLIGRRLDTSPDTVRASRQFIFLWGMVCVGIFLVYVAGAKSFPLKALIIDAEDIATTRKMRAVESSRGYIFGLAQVFLMPFLFIAILTSWGYYRSVVARGIAVSALAMVLIYNSYSSRKTPVAMLFVLALFLWMHYRTQSSTASRRGTQRQRWRLRRYLLVAVIFGGLIGYPLFIYAAKPFAQNRSLYELFVFGVLRRVFVNPATNAYVAFEVFGTRFDFTYFRDVQKFAWLFDLDYFDLSSKIAYYKYKEDMNAPPPSIGTFYAQAGWPMVIIGVLGAATIMRLFECVLLRVNKTTPIHFALYTILLYGAFRFSFGHFHTILLTESIVPSMFVLLLWNFMAVRQRVDCSVVRSKTRRGSTVF